MVEETGLRGDAGGRARRYDDDGFRLAAASDVEEVVRLVRSAYRGQTSREGWTSEADLVEGDRIDASQVREILANARSRLIVLPDAQGFLACCQIVDVGAGLASLGTLAVRPLSQGRGVGRRVISEAERFARTAFGSGQLEISVLAAQTELVAYYQRIGFRPTGETRPFPADPRFARPRRKNLSFLVLRKNLAVATTLHATAALDPGRADTVVVPGASGPLDDPDETGVDTVPMLFARTPPASSTTGT